MSADSSQTAPASPLDISSSESEQLGQTGIVRQWMTLLNSNIDDLRPEDQVVDSFSDEDANRSLLGGTPGNSIGLDNARKRPPNAYGSENQENHRPVLGELYRCSLTATWACGSFQYNGLIGMENGLAEFSFTPNPRIGPINITMDIRKSKESIRQTMQPHNNQRNDNGRPAKRESCAHTRHRIGKSTTRSRKSQRSQRRGIGARHAQKVQGRRGLMRSESCKFCASTSVAAQGRRVSGQGLGAWRPGVYIPPVVPSLEFQLTSCTGRRRNSPLFGEWKPFSLRRPPRPSGGHFRVRSTTRT
jgi:hypothetical protein